MGEPIRVLHVINKMVLEGAESRIMDLYRKTDTSKIQFDFAVHDSAVAYYDQEIKERGGKIYVWPRFGFRTIFKYINEVNRFFREHKDYKIVHGHIVSYGFVYQLIALINGVKIRIAHARTSSIEKTLRGYLTLFTIMPLRFFVTNHFACSTLAGEFAYGKRYVKKGRVRIINNAIDAEKFSFSEENRQLVRNEFGIQGKFVIGHVGSFRYAKNHSFLLDVFEEVSKNQNDSVLLLVGTGKLKEEIMNKAISLGILEKVIFAGQRSDVNTLLSAMDILIFPSHYEGLPGAVIEAQAAGLFCLVSDNVSHEVCITDLVQFISLKDHPKVWADVALKKIDYVRKDAYNEIVAAGFDVKTITCDLEKFYLKSMEQCKFKLEL